MGTESPAPDRTGGGLVIESAAVGCLCDREALSGGHRVDLRHRHITPLWRLHGGPPGHGLLRGRRLYHGRLAADVARVGEGRLLGSGKAAGVLLIDLQREQRRFILPVAAYHGDTLEARVRRRDDERQPLALRQPTHLLGRKWWLSGPPDAHRAACRAYKPHQLLTLALGASQLGWLVRIGGCLVGSRHLDLN
eukprot:scaffold87250_cov65-Phaeocystis_antarctica.AAC.2